MDRLKPLKNWINNDYLNAQTIIAIKQAFESNNPKSIQLNHFLQDNKFRKLQKVIIKSEFESKYKPNFYSFYKAKKTNKHVNEFINFLKSKEFISLMSFIYDKKITLKSIEIIKFEHKNYMLINDKLREHKGLKIIFDFTNDWNNEFGGYNSYVHKSEELLRVIPATNSLSIINLDGKIKSFVKYVNNKAGKNKSILLVLNFNKNGTARNFTSLY